MKNQVHCQRAIVKQLNMKQKGGFIPILLGTLAASVLGNDLAVNDLFDLVKKQLDQAEIFNAASFFN